MVVVVPKADASYFITPFSYVNVLVGSDEASKAFEVWAVSF